MKHTKIVFFILIQVIFVSGLNAQNVQTFYGEKLLIDDICKKIMTPLGFKEKKARELVNKITTTCSMPISPYHLKECSGLDNAVAIILDGKQYIAYDPEFIDKIENGDKTDWTKMAILAHEVGHHILAHTLNPIDQVDIIKQRELEADQFSGSVLCKLGAKLEQAQTAVKAASRKGHCEFCSHPSQEMRMEAIAKGFKKENCSNLYLTNDLSDIFISPPYKINDLDIKWIQGNYDYIYPFSEGFAKVVLNNKFGLININGEEVVPPKYSKISDFSEGLTGIELNNKWGFIDRQGKVIVSPTYDDVDSFKEGLAKVVLNNKVGLININGEEVVPPKYSKISDFSEGLAKVKINSRYGFVNKKGEEIISTKYKSAWNFSNGVAIVILEGEKNFNLINTKGEIIDIPNSKYIVRAREKGYAIIKINEKYGMIDAKGKIVVEPKFEYVKPLYTNKKAIIELNGKKGVVNFRGEIIVKPIYDYIFFKNDFFYTTKDGKKGCLNKNGTEIIPPIYDDVDDFINGFVEVKILGKSGLISKNGYVTIPPKYEFISINPYNNNFFIVELKGKQGMVNREDKEIIPFKDKSLFFENFCYCFPGDPNESGYINKEGKAITLKYEMCHSEVSHLGIVINSDSKMGIINEEGIEIIPLIFDEIESTKKNEMIVRYKNHWGILKDPVLYPPKKKVN